MICKNCGKEIHDDSNFCNYCGVKQKGQSSQHAAPNTNAQATHKQERKLLTLKQAIFWGLFFIYSLGWILSFLNHSFPTNYDKGKAILFWILPLLFVVVKRSIKSFTKK